MKDKALFFCLILTALLCRTPAAWGWPQWPDEAENILAPLLFPSAADWLKLGDAPKVPEERLKALAPRLKPVLRPLSAAAGSENEACSVTERLFEEACCFYSLDADGDGLEDIVYSGYFPCGEGGLNIIWHNDGQGDYVLKGDSLDYGHLLRLRPGPDGPLKLRHEPGCCGDFIDRYYQDASGEPRKYCAETFSAPLGGIDFQKPLLNRKITLKDWVELRNSPETDDEYDAGISAGLGYVFMGNILTIVSSYDRQKPCRGTLLAYDPDGVWGLAVLEADCEARQEFSVSKGDFIRVGWVKSDAFELDD
jgi:hypothetical protein